MLKERFFAGETFAATISTSTARGVRGQASCKRLVRRRDTRTRGDGRRLVAKLVSRSVILGKEQGVGSETSEESMLSSLDRFLVTDPRVPVMTSERGVPSPRNQPQSCDWSGHK